MVLRAAVLAVVALFGAPAVAGAVTLADIIQLSKAGLPDAVLTALIDADRTVFTLNAEQILQLRDAGVSEAVMLKLIGTRRWDDVAAQPVPVQPGQFSDGSIGPELVIIGEKPPSPATEYMAPLFVPFGFGSPFFESAPPRRRHPHRAGSIGPGPSIRNGQFVGLEGSTFEERRARSLRPFESSGAPPAPGRR